MPKGGVLLAHANISRLEDEEEPGKRIGGDSHRGGKKTTVSEPVIWQSTRPEKITLFQLCLLQWCFEIR